uniref:Uncharacterized protein n=1 Tax=Arundo donax TaxID=35708 RepID=A0A0A9PVT0_ARUDO
MSVPSLHHIHSIALDFIALLGFLGDRSISSMHLSTTRCRASFPKLVAVQHAMPMQVQSSHHAAHIATMQCKLVEACSTLINRLATTFYAANYLPFLSD